jgi:DNA processing protein
MQRIDFHIPELEQMKHYPDPLYFEGNPELLRRTKIGIVGSRRPTPYTRHLTQELAAKLSRAGVCIVSGAAMGVDKAAHVGALEGGTIAVMGNGLDIRYPAGNAGLIESIEQQGLTLSQFEPGMQATHWSFVVRNEVVAALGEALIVTQADLKSGSLTSAEYALAMGKPVYVLPQRIGESEGTNALLEAGKAEAIYSIDAFVARYAKVATATEDPFLQFCLAAPTYEEAAAFDSQTLYAYELEGKITVADGRVRVN